MSRKEKPKRFVGPLYRYAPFLPKDAFVDHIRDFEKKQGRPISCERAEEIFVILREQSRAAERAGRLNGIWIVFDQRATEWGGYKIGRNRVKYGMENNTKRGEQSKGGHREKFENIAPCSKQDFLDEIMEIEGCGIDRAKQILKSCHANDIARYDKPTNTWRGWRKDPPALAETAEAAPTLKYQEYRRKYGCMPWLTHDWQNPEQSEVLKWIVARDAELGEQIEIAEAEKRYRRGWSYKSKCPWVKDKKTKRIRGVDYGDTAVFRQMPRMHEESDEFNAWLRKNVSEDYEKARFQLVDAEKHGHVVELSGNDRDGYELAGVDWLSEQADDEDIPRDAEYDDEDDHEDENANECDDDGDDDDEAESGSASGICEDTEEKARRDKEAADRRAKVDDWIESLRASDQAAKEAPSKAAKADPTPQPAQTVSADPEATEVAQEAPRTSGRGVRGTARSQYPQEYADSEENLALWREDVFRSRERYDDGDISADYPIEVEVEA